MKIPLLLLHFLCLLLLLVSNGDSAAVTVDGNGDLVVAPRSGGSVLFRGVDVPAAVTAAAARLAVLETTFQLAAARPVAPTNPSAATCSCDESRSDCTPAVRFPNGSVACCTSDQSIATCRWTGLGTLAAAAAQCNLTLAAGGPKDAPNPLLGFDDKVILNKIKIIIITNYKQLAAGIFVKNKCWSANDPFPFSFFVCFSFLFLSFSFLFHPPGRVFVPPSELGGAGDSPAPRRHGACLHGHQLE